MKIDSNGAISSRPLRPARGPERSAAGGFAGYLSDAAAAGGGSGAAPVGGVNVLLALQAVDDVQERRRRAVRRGGRLLDLLDELRLGLLAGGLSPGVIADLARTLDEARAEVDDPGLLAVLEAVELRAQVELAKHQQAPRPG
jgi:hypothetical protein